MQYWVMEKNDVLGMLAEPEEDGVKYLMIEEVQEGRVFWGKIPYDELKKFASGMVEIDPDTFELTDVPLIDSE